MIPSTVVRAGSAVAAASALVLAGMLTPASAASSTGSVKGAVVIDGQPVAFAKVQLYPLVLDRSTDDYELGQRLKTANTDSAGRYSFARVPATSSTTNRYVVLVTDRRGKGVTSYRKIVLKSGRTLTRNVTLPPAVALTGTVKRSDGQSPEGLTVRVETDQFNDLGDSFDPLFPRWSTSVNPDGSYRLGGIPAVSGKQVLVSDGPYAQQCVDTVAAALVDCATAGSPGYADQLVSVDGGQQRVLPTLTMTKSAPAVTTMKGRVTDTSGKPLEGVDVLLYSSHVRVTATTRSSGRYTIKESIPAGRYSVRFDDPKGTWASQFLGGGPDRTTRRLVVVAPGTPVNGLDTRLKSRATVKTAIRGGDGTAKVAVRIVRKASGSAPSGTLTVSFDGRSKTVDVVKGRAVVTLTDLPSGALSLSATYSGTSSTAGFTRALTVDVR